MEKEAKNEIRKPKKPGLVIALAPLVAMGALLGVGLWNLSDPTPGSPCLRSLYYRELRSLFAFQMERYGEWNR